MWIPSSHLLLYQDTSWSLSQVDKETLNTSDPLASPLLLQRGKREPLTISSAALLKSSRRARRSHYQASRRRQHPRVTIRWWSLDVAPSASRSQMMQHTRFTVSLTKMQSQGMWVSESVGRPQVCSMYASHGQERSHKQAPLLSIHLHSILAIMRKLPSFCALMDGSRHLVGRSTV
jgi:hypothetical protein